MSDEWMLIGVEDKIAKRHGIPPRIPVPKAEFEGLADSGLPPEKVRAWITKFLATYGAVGSGFRKQEAELAARYDAFIGKAEHWKKAEEAFSKGDVQKAIQALRLITAVDPNDHAARMNLASAYASSGDPKKALEQLRAIRDTFEGDPDYHVTVGQVQLALKERDAAIDELVNALEVRPDHQQALDLLKQLGVLSAIYENPRDATSLTYVRSDKVLEWLEGDVWAREPRSARYYLEQIAYHEPEQRFAVVLAAAVRGLAAAENDSDANELQRERLALARIAALRKLGRADEALSEAQAYAAAHPRSAPAEVELSRALSAAGKADEAKAAVQRALQIDPGDLEALDLAFWPDDRGDLQQVLAAIPALQAHVDRHPQSSGAVRSLARAKLTTGAVDEALSLFARAVQLAPDDDGLRSEWWVELTRAHRLDELLADADKITDLAKRDWKLRWSEAEAYAALGKKDQAYAAFAAINHDESLLVDVRRRAKRAAQQIQSTPDAPPTR